MPAETDLTAAASEKGKNTRKRATRTEKVANFMLLGQEMTSARDFVPSVVAGWWVVLRVDFHRQWLLYTNANYKLTEAWLY